MRSNEGFSYANVTTTQGPFVLKGGKYLVQASATFGGGSVKLQRLSNDGSTYQSVGTSTDFTANGVAAVDLAPGSYEFVVATATAVYAQIARIPND